MMQNLQLQQELVNAELSIKSSGTRATSHRKKLLCLLLCSPIPLSAYELTKLFNETYNECLIANSVYRILKDLISARLAHRLATINKYIACQSENCMKADAFPLFTICHKCLHVEEASAPTALVKAITQTCDNSIFKQITPQVELSGLCSCCNQVSSCRGDENA